MSSDIFTSLLYSFNGFPALPVFIGDYLLTQLQEFYFIPLIFVAVFLTYDYVTMGWQGSKPHFFRYGVACSAVYGILSLNMPMTEYITQVLGTEPIKSKVINEEGKDGAYLVGEKLDINASEYLQVFSDVNHYAIIELMSTVISFSDTIANNLTRKIIYGTSDPKNITGDTELNGYFPALIYKVNDYRQKRQELAESEKELLNNLAEKVAEANENVRIKMMEYEYNLCLKYVDRSLLSPLSTYGVFSTSADGTTFTYAKNGSSNFCNGIKEAYQNEKNSGTGENYKAGDKNTILSSKKSDADLASISLDVLLNSIIEAKIKYEEDKQSNNKPAKPFDVANSDSATDYYGKTWNMASRKLLSDFYNDQSKDKTGWGSNEDLLLALSNRGITFNKNDTNPLERLKAESANLKSSTNYFDNRLNTPKASYNDFTTKTAPLFSSIAVLEEAKIEALIDVAKSKNTKESEAEKESGDLDKQFAFLDKSNKTGRDYIDWVLNGVDSTRNTQLEDEFVKALQNQGASEAKVAIARTMFAESAYSFARLAATILAAYDYADAVVYYAQKNNVKIASDSFRTELLKQISFIGEYNLESLVGDKKIREELAARVAAFKGSATPRSSLALAAIKKSAQAEKSSPDKAINEDNIKNKLAHEVANRMNDLSMARKLLENTVSGYLSDMTALTGPLFSIIDVVAGRVASYQDTLVAKSFVLQQNTLRADKQKNITTFKEMIKAFNEIRPAGTIPIKAYDRPISWIDLGVFYPIFKTSWELTVRNAFILSQMGKRSEASISSLADMSNNLSRTTFNEAMFGIGAGSSIVGGIVQAFKGAKTDKGISLDMSAGLLTAVKILFYVVMFVFFVNILLPTGLWFIALVNYFIEIALYLAIAPIAIILMVFQVYKGAVQKYINVLIMLLLYPSVLVAMFFIVLFLDMMLPLMIFSFIPFFNDPTATAGMISSAFQVDTNGLSDLVEQMSSFIGTQGIAGNIAGLIGIFICMMLQVFLSSYLIFMLLRVQSILAQCLQGSGFNMVDSGGFAQEGEQKIKMMSRGSAMTGSLGMI